MKKSILIELLQKFSSKEMKEFEEFVHSPFFNKNQSVVSFFDYLRKQYPAFDDSAVGKKAIYSKIFPGIEYNDGFMRMLMFNLAGLAEHYLAFTGFRESLFAEERSLLHKLNEKDCDRLIERKMKEISKKLENTSIRNTDYFYSKFMIEYEYFYYQNRVNLDKIEKVINRPEVEKMFNNITDFYFLQAIKHYVFYLNRQNLYHIDFKPEFLEDMFKIIDPKYLHRNPIVSLYYNVLMLYLKGDDYSNYYNAKEKVLESENMINKHDLIWIYTNLQDYCKKMINKGNNKFLRELFNIYKIKIEKKIYAWEEMPAKFYIGVADTALKLKEFDWALEFMEKYKSELALKIKDNIYFYSLALYEFSRKNFESSLELLSKVKYTEIYQKADVRCLTAKLYYELEMDDLLITHIDSFRHFLMNDKLIAQEKKKDYSNFIKIIKLLYIIKSKNNKEGAQLLAKKITDHPTVFDRDWLLEKIWAILD